jgi:hypothetical protein
MNPEVIDRLRRFLRSTRGRIMTVEFTKRSTGELRTMTCRTGVRKYKVDPDAPPDPALVAQDIRNGLLRVFDVNATDPKRPGQKGAYRMIALEGLKRIRAQGEEFTP